MMIFIIGIYDILPWAATSRKQQVLLLTDTLTYNNLSNYPEAHYNITTEWIRMIKGNIESSHVALFINLFRLSAWFTFTGRPQQLVKIKVEISLLSCDLVRLLLSCCIAVACPGDPTTNNTSATIYSCLCCHYACFYSHCTCFCCYYW